MITPTMAAIPPNINKYACTKELLCPSLVANSRIKKIIPGQNSRKIPMFLIINLTAVNALKMCANGPVYTTCGL